MKRIALGLLLLCQSAALAAGSISAYGIVSRKPGPIIEGQKQANTTSLLVVVKNETSDTIEVPTCGYTASVWMEEQRCKIRLSLSQETIKGDGVSSRSSKDSYQTVRLEAGHEVFFAVRILDKVQLDDVVDIQFVFAEADCARYGLPVAGISFTVDPQSVLSFFEKRDLGIREGRAITAPRCDERAEPKASGLE